MGKIDNKDVQDIWPLTSLQEGMLFHYVQTPENKYYFEQLCLTFSGKMDLALVKKAWHVVIFGNELLRTVYRWEKLEKPIQIILKTLPVPIRIYDLLSLSEQEKAQQIAEIKQRDQDEKIDLFEEPFRITVILVTNSQSLMMISNHHILYDGWSTGIILREFLQAYHIFGQGEQPNNLQKNSFKKFVDWVNNLDQVMMKTYWTDYLAGFDSKTPLPLAKEEREKHRQKNLDLVEKYVFTLDQVITEEIKTFTTNNQITLAAFLYGVWGILLQRCNDQNDVVFGTTVSGRNTDLLGIEEMVGLFINTIPLRVRTDGEGNSLSLVKDLDRGLRERSKYEHLPLVEIKSCSVIDAREVLFDSIVVIENYPLEKEINKIATSLKLESFEIFEATNFALTLAIEFDKQIKIQFAYTQAQFSTTIIRRLSAYFLSILASILENPYGQLREIELLSEEEKRRLLNRFNDRSLDYPREKTIDQLFVQQVDLCPEQIAVKYLDQKLTYRELNDRTDQLASILRQRGVSSGSIVGLLVERSLEMVIGIFGILKAGGAYLPISPDYPESRITYLLEDSGAEVLLTQKSLRNRSFITGQVIFFQDLNLEIKMPITLALVEKKNSETLAYLIYTSGSTGNPKGVMISHQAVNNFLFNIYNSFLEDVGTDDNCLSLTNIAFDVSVCEIFLPLVFGATLILYAHQTIPDIQQLVNTIQDEKITFAYIPPTILKEVNQALSSTQISLNKLLVGVEPIKDFILTDYLALKPDLQIINGYGPTETTICATFYKYIDQSRRGRNVPIGRPLANVQTYILDKDSNLLPEGAVGELCISGEGLAEGYWQREKLTQERFIDHPFLPGKRLYQTGDLARWSSDGNLEFIGRKDQQVKVRGYRVELGEIEVRLLNYPGIREAFVTDKMEKKTGSKSLVAYIVVDKTFSRKEFTSRKLREFMAESLPTYMIPTHFISLKALPLTLNGKIDRQALPEPKNTVDSTYLSPRTKLEEDLVEIWKTVLSRERVGIDDDFFELGGHSLKATLLVAKIHKELDIHLPVGEIFDRPTIKELGEYIQGFQPTTHAAIEKVARSADGFYQTSSAQRRMYMLQQLDLVSTSYHISGILEITGLLEIEKVEKILNQLIERHETLRTSLTTRGEEIVQKVWPSLKIKVELLKGFPERAELMTAFIRSFDLNEAPLWRVGALSLTEQSHLLLFDLHHIISDGMSMDILAREFTELYFGKDLAELRIQYKDYAAWQSAYLRSKGLIKQREYWINRFADQVPVLNLPTDYPRSTLSSNQGDTLLLRLDEQLTKSLRCLARETSSSLYMVLLSGVNILLAKYSGQEDIIIGTPIAGRTHADLEPVIGLFINTLVIRNQLKGEKKYLEFFQEVRTNVLNAFLNQDYPLEELVDQLNEKKLLVRDFSRNPLFDVIFSLENFHHGDLRLEDLKFKLSEYQNKQVKFDLAISAREDLHGVSEEILLKFTYKEQLFKKATILRMMHHLKKILKVITQNPQIQLAEIEMLSAEERSTILDEFNHTARVPCPKATIPELFEAQAAKRPDQIAVIYGEESLTYGQLNARANQIAYALRAQGVRRESIVGILVQRSLEMMIGIMGILKAGGAYLPILPSYPKERIKYLLDDSQIQILLTDQQQVGEVDFTGQVMELTTEKTSTANQENLEQLNTPRDLAYVLYTSGSTGRPKGVLVEQLSVINTIRDLQEKYPLDQHDIILQSTVFTFDASVREIFWWFFQGAKCCLLVPGGERDPREIINTIAQHKITVAKFVPVLLNEILIRLEAIGIEPVSSLKYLLVGGEALNYQIANKFFELFGETDTPKMVRPRFINVYGPSEATIHCTDYEITAPINSQFALLGRPIANNQIYLLDRNLKPVPFGIPGEIYLTGVGLAREYLNNPQLTDQRFIPNPFQNDNDMQSRMYRTGDLGRWHLDGNIEFLSRIDQQVQIHGLRVELGEIESQLLSHEGVKEAIVIVRQDSGSQFTESKYLCAYLTTFRKILPKELRAYLSKKLPEYLIPSFFVLLDALPLLPNGKVNRQSLPEPDETLFSDREYVPPQTEIEKKLAVIWSQLLGIERIGITDHFFHLGGHSLKATILSGKIYQEFDVEIPLGEIFKAPTIKEISLLIANTSKTRYHPIERIPESQLGYYETSSAQKRMFLLQELEPERIGYNMTAILEVTGRCKIEKIEQAFLDLINRHETLRTSFQLVGEKLVQRIHQRIKFKVEHLLQVDQSLEELIKKFIRPFNLCQAPLLRVGFIPLGAEQSILLFDLHHIISDGFSLGIMMRDFQELYQKKQLADLKIQYKDFASWQNAFFSSPRFFQEEAYWLSQLSGELPLLNLSLDYPRPAVKSLEGDFLVMTLPEKLVTNLHQLAYQRGGTLYMVLLATFSLLLSRYSNQTELLIGSPIAGRSHPDVEELIGMFVNTLVMRHHPQGEKSFSSFFKEVQETALGAFLNQDYPFELLVEKLAIPRDLSRNPLFDVMFVLQNNEQPKLTLSNLTMIPRELDYKIAKFDILLNVQPTEDNRLICKFEYSTQLFQHQTIERMAKHYQNLLQSVVANPELPLRRVEMIIESERHLLTIEFNKTQESDSLEKTIPELFLRQVHRVPKRLAVVSGEESYTYAELNRRANHLAWLLRQKGVGRNQIVGIMAIPTLETIVGILAIIKAGGAYLPLNLEYPKERLEYILADADVQILMTSPPIASDLVGQMNMFDTITLTRDNVSDTVKADIDVINRPEDLIYVMYTSGSTGQPKGVMVEHRNVNRLISDENLLSIKEEDRVLQLGSLAFDASTFELWSPLTHGARVCLIQREEVLSAVLLEERMVDYRITMIFMTVSLFNLYAEQRPTVFKTLKKLMVGGEAVSAKHLSLVRRLYPGLKLYNAYGPTECTTFAAAFFIEKDYYADNSKSNVPIGRPINHTQLFVLNADHGLCPIGVAGELWIGGAGVARGYLNQPELTVEKFVQLPEISNSHLYRTGDLVRWVKEGVLEYIGRIDQQVKIRGFRIELGEIEQKLLTHPEIKETVVIALKDKTGIGYLAAYYVATSQLTMTELRKYLIDLLPEYMVPSYFIPLEALPLNINKKIELAALPDPLIMVQSSEGDAPQTEGEERLAAIWQDILGTKEISRRAHFFELGGHSLKATQLAMRILNDFGLHLALEEVFRYPVLKDLAAQIQDLLQDTGDQKKMLAFQEIAPVEEADYYELSFAQKRLWYLSELQPNSSAYNMPSQIVFREEVDPEQMTAVLNRLIQRHESFRTWFTVIQGQVVQVIADQIEFKLAEIDLSNLADEQKEGQRDDIYSTEANQPFDLGRAPLFRAILLKMAEDHYELILTQHHIISDGWSTEILKREFTQLYQGVKAGQQVELPQLEIQYKDFAVWQNRLFQDPIRMEEAKNFWREQLSNLSPLHLPRDYIGITADQRGAAYRMVISSKTQAGIEALANQSGTSLFTILLTTFQLFLAKVCSQSSVQVGVPIAGREHKGLQNVVGFFVNTTIAWMKINPDRSFRQHLERVHDQLLQMLTYQGYPLELIVDELKIDYPEISVFFNLLNMGHRGEGFLSETESYHISDVADVKFPLACYLEEHTNGIELRCHYLSSFFQPETIETLFLRYQEMLAEVVSDPNQIVANYGQVSQRRRICYGDDCQKNSSAGRRS